MTDLKILELFGIESSLDDPWPLTLLNFDAMSAEDISKYLAPELQRQAQKRRFDLIPLGTVFASAR